MVNESVSISDRKRMLAAECFRVMNTNTTPPSPLHSSQIDSGIIATTIRISHNMHYTVMQ